MYFGLPSGSGLCELIIILCTLDCRLGVDFVSSVLFYVLWIAEWGKYEVKRGQIPLGADYVRSVFCVLWIAEWGKYEAKKGQIPLGAE